MGYRISPCDGCHHFIQTFGRDTTVSLCGTCQMRALPRSVLGRAAAHRPAAALIILVILVWHLAGLLWAKPAAGSRPVTEGAESNTVSYAR